VREVRSRMYVRDLYGSAKNQQQCTTKSKREPPRMPAVLPPRIPQVIFRSLIVHLYNYNVTPLPERSASRVCGQKELFLACFGT